MKKILIGSAILLAITASGVYGYHINCEANEGLSSLTLANIEALADPEVDNTPGMKKCYSSITSDDAQWVRYCPTCEVIPGTDTWYAPSHECEVK